jgi:K+-transporting ATPase ATPase C chain
MRSLIRQLRPAFVALLVLSALTGIVYPLVVTGVAQVAFRHQANGSVVKLGGVAVGSSLIGQDFADVKYFHPRPSAPSYDAMASGASNLGPTNPDFLAQIEKRVADYRTENGLATDQQVPVDAVTASGSGLDPDISVANARLQAARVAKARGMEVGAMMTLIDDHTTGRQWGFLGEPRVNVLAINLALDAKS